MANNTLIDQLRHQSPSRSRPRLLSSTDEQGSWDGGSQQDRPQALFWELLTQEELDMQGHSSQDLTEHSCHVVDIDGDILVFEAHGRRSLLRRYIVAEACWRVQSIRVAVHAATVSPANPRVVCILHCPSDWSSDHRYEVHSFNVDTNELEPQYHQLVDVGIAPKKRHGFSIAPFDDDNCIYLLCGLQHFPGDTTGSFVYCFNLDSNAWSQVEYEGEFPAPCAQKPYIGCRFGQSCVVYDKRAWLFGGCVKGETGMESTNDFFTFHLAEHKWEKVDARGELKPPPLSGHAALECQGRMFIFTSQGASVEVYSFNMTAMRWELLPEIMLGPRPTDGRVFCCRSGEKLMTYQQYEDDSPGSNQRRQHELFGLDVNEALQALGQSGPQGAQHPRNRQELDLLGDHATADVAFTVEGRKVVAHKKVLQRFSPALSRFFDVPTAGTDRSPASPGNKLARPVRLDNVKYIAFCTLLEHIYSRFTKSLQPADAEHLLELAQQFELTAFVQRCQDNVIIDASNVRRFLDVAQKVGAPLYLLNQKCIAYLIEHPEHLGLVKGPVKHFSGSGSVSPEVPPLSPAPRHPLEHPTPVTRPSLGAPSPYISPAVVPAPSRAILLQDSSVIRHQDAISASPPDLRPAIPGPSRGSVAMAMSMHATGPAPQGQFAGTVRHHPLLAGSYGSHMVQTPQYWPPPYYIPARSTAPQ